jgi:hypothetical protein
MAVTQTFSGLFKPGVLVPIGGYPPISPNALDSATVVATISTTDLSTATNTQELIPLPLGRAIRKLMFFTNRAGDTNGSPLLAANLILRTTDASGANTDVVLYTGTTGFQAQAGTATDPLIVLFPDPPQTGSVTIPASGPGVSFARLVFVVTTPPATAQSFSLTAELTWK